MSEGRFPLLLVGSLCFGLLLVAFLPRPPNNAIPIRAYEGWSPEPAAEGGGSVSYPHFDSSLHQGPQSWSVLEGSQLVWQLSDDPSLTVHFSVEGSFQIDLLALRDSSGSIQLGSPQTSRSDIATALKRMANSAETFQLLLNADDAGPSVFSALRSVELTTSFQGSLGPMSIDVRPTAEFGAGPADTLQIQLSFQVEPSAHEWSPEWSLLRETLGAPGAEHTPMLIKLVVTLERSSP